MAVSGHSTLAQAQIYIEEADREKMAGSAMRKVRERTRIVKTRT
jgi:hypothetical protein